MYPSLALCKELTHIGYPYTTKKIFDDLSVPSCGYKYPDIAELLEVLPEFIRGGRLGVSMDQKLNIKKYGGYYYAMYSCDDWKGSPKIQVSDKSFANCLAKLILELHRKNLLDFNPYSLHD